ncbi:MAG: hypothetical protein QME28_00725 [Candidatus Saccharicenans sp.]|nr:hypothetical protein [Candidatus Saccharicenans sp.]
MNGCSYIGQGVRRASARFRLAVYLWLILMVLALLAAAPVNSLIRNQLGQLYFPVKPLQPFELYLVDVFLTNQHFFSSFAGFLLSFLSLAVVLFVFLNAGLFGRMLTPDPVVTFREFLADGCRHFWRFLLSLLVFLPFLAIFFLLYRLLSAPLNLWSRQAVTEWPVIIASNLRMLLAILLWTAFKLFLDLARIIIVHERKKVIHAYAAALRFLRRNFLKLWGLYLLLGLGVVLVSFLLLLSVSFSGSATPAGLFFSILLAQLFIIFRLFARQAFIGLEYIYFLENRGNQG